MKARRDTSQSALGAAVFCLGEARRKDNGRQGVAGQDNTASHRALLGFSFGSRERGRLGGASSSRRRRRLAREEHRLACGSSCAYSWMGHKEIDTRWKEWPGGSVGTLMSMARSADDEGGGALKNRPRDGPP
ncbi:hypothetical protein MRX96_009823 [Rhipicephalus microplus]